MFYKFENETWHTAYTVRIPSGEYLTENNKIKIDGWEWHDEPPQEYLDWLQQQQEIEEIEM